MALTHARLRRCRVRSMRLDADSIGVWNVAQAILERRATLPRAAIVFHTPLLDHHPVLIGIER